VANGSILEATAKFNKSLFQKQQVQVLDTEEAEIPCEKEVEVLEVDDN
jgi:hypothetical protein